MSVVVVGLGEMGGVFSRGFLRLGHTVVPVIRASDPARVAADIPDPELVLVAVGEGDLALVLRRLPRPWMKRVGLLQNELLPVDWTREGIEDPTVAVVWFEKKPGTEVKPILPTAVAGPAAKLVVDALTALKIPAHIAERAELVPALVRKNLYILTANIAGLVGAPTVGGLLADRTLLDAVALEVLSLESARAGGVALPVDRLLAELRGAFEADPSHASKGRSAPARLERAILRADQLGVAVPRLREIAAARL